MIISPEPGGANVLPCCDVSVASTIRNVVEELSGDKRPRAVVRIPTMSLFIHESEALYDTSTCLEQSASKFSRGR